MPKNTKLALETFVDCDSLKENLRSKTDRFVKIVNDSNSRRINDVLGASMVAQMVNNLPAMRET